MDRYRALDRNLISSVSTKSAKLFGALFFALSSAGIAFTPLQASAEDAFRLNAGAGISAMLFDYSESNVPGIVLDAEQGDIHGASFRLGLGYAGWDMDTALSYHRGRVTYDGHLSSGVPYMTRTDEAIADVSLRLGYWLDLPYPVQPYLGVGYRRWDRDILPGTSSGNPINGLFESYRWNYLWLGAQVLTRLDDGSQTVFDVGLLKPLRPEMRIDFRGSYPVSPTVYPESKLGWRVSLTSSLPLSGGNRLAIVPYFEYWELGRSPTVNAGSISVYEPASKTGNAGVNLRLDWSL